MIADLNILTFHIMLTYYLKLSFKNLTASSIIMYVQRKRFIFYQFKRGRPQMTSNKAGVKDFVTTLLKPAVLKLRVATLLRVAKFQKRVAKLWNLEKNGLIWSNKPKIQSIFTFRGSQNFLRVASFDKQFFGVASKKVWEPLLYDVTTYYPLQVFVY